MKTLYHLLLNSLLVAIANNFVWFALTFWVYLSTRSVISTSIVSGIFMITSTFSGVMLGNFVDKYPKKKVMLYATLASAIFYALAFILYIQVDPSNFSILRSSYLWIFVSLNLVGVIIGNVRNIVIPALIPTLVGESERDRANGLAGTVTGISFSLASVLSGLILASWGIIAVLIIAIFVSLFAFAYLTFLSLPGEVVESSNDKDVHNYKFSATFRLVRSISGLLPLILFTTFNNFLGGIFMALMDAYGLSLVPLQVWGTMWGFLSLGFILGGLYIAKKGLGGSPLRSLFRINIVLWVVTIFFAIQPSIYLLAGGMLIYVILVPFVEAIEHTIMQKVVPKSRLGRVFGFAQSIETAASPISSFAIGPLAELYFIPFMTTGAGVTLLGPWFGIGTGRGIALVFIAAGIIGLVVTLISMRSRAYLNLASKYNANKV